MSNIAVIHSPGKSITIAGNGQHYVVPHTFGAFERIVDCWKAGNVEKALRLANKAAMIEEYGGGLFQIVDGLVHVDGEPVADAVSKRIMDFANQGLPVKPIVEFCSNINDNPSESSRAELYLFLEANDIPLTEDGCFLAYKSVSKAEDGTLWDTYTFNRSDDRGTYRNNPGDTPTMERDQVDDNRDQTCSAGLHVAAFNYAKNNYGFGDRKTLVTVKVNPADVVSVPSDYNNEKMRTCKYTVLDIIEEEVKETTLVQEEDELEDNGTLEDLEGSDELDDAEEGVTTMSTGNLIATQVSRRADGAVEIPRRVIDEVGSHALVTVDAEEDRVVITLDEGERRLIPGFRVNKKILDAACLGDDLVITIESDEIIIS